MWWSSLCIMIVEGSMFLFALISYFYLQGSEYDWPPGAVRYPGLVFPTINTAILLASIVPNYMLKHAAEKMELQKVRRLMVLMNVVSVAFLTVRALEFTRMNVHWTDNAYGSILWTLLGLHTAHLLTDAFDTLVLTVMMFRPPVEGRRFVDVDENCLYWDFVVASWLPIYFVIYLLPRL